VHFLLFILCWFKLFCGWSTLLWPILLYIDATIIYDLPLGLDGCTSNDSLWCIFSCCGTRFVLKLGISVRVHMLLFITSWFVML
jgi:hypothetical protein